MENELSYANGAGVELKETDLSGAAVVENEELSNANGAGVDGPKDFKSKVLAPNENADGLAKGKFAF